MTQTNPIYQKNPSEWIQWLNEKLEIDEEQGILMLAMGEFPFSSLKDAWHVEFTPRKGYSPEFIPALGRNIIGFLQWVYGDGNEPDWRGSDK
jgi:hypothetical protein